MDLKRRIGELFIVGFQGQRVIPGSQLEYDISEGNLGGIILFDRCISEPDKQGNIRSAEQLQNLVSTLQALASAPLLVCIDQEGGLVQRLNPANGFPGSASAEEMGSADISTDFTATQARLTAQTLASLGINVNFAPVVDLNINRSNPIIGKVKRSFSDDPDVVIRHAEAWIHCHTDYQIISCLKHFPGHGSSAADSHLGFVDISASWKEYELTPYRGLISRQLVDVVMVGHLFNKTLDPYLPATLSHAIVTGLLRQQLGYEGLILTDDLQMKAITSRFGFDDALCKSLAAGIDMIVIGNNLEHNPNILSEAVHAVWEGVQRGIVTEKRLISALNKVQQLKQRLAVKKNEIRTHNP